MKVPCTKFLAWVKKIEPPTPGGWQRFLDGVPSLLRVPLEDRVRGSFLWGSSTEGLPNRIALQLDLAVRVVA